MIALVSVALAAGCTFQAGPDRFLSQQSRIHRGVFEAAKQFKPPLMRKATANASEIPRLNLIDDAIFGKLESASIPSARLATDEEFLRRIYYDLTGHPPSPAEVREFVSNGDSGKRREVIDRLLYSPGFNDKWTMWLGDLLQNAAFPQNFDRQYFGRNAYYEWMLRAIAAERSMRDLALEAIAGTGNSYKAETGGVNFPLNGISAMGPVQDTYDNLAKITMSTWLGLSHYDCLLCHDGRRHLDQVSAWGAEGTRLEAMRLAAFFSRISLAKPRLAATEFFYNSYDVGDARGGGYLLNTNSGNRPDRKSVDGSNTLDPVYRNGRKPDDGNYRQAIAAFVVDDPMFAVNFANRLWKEIFGLGLAEPVDSLDPYRLDPGNPPADPWTFQSAYPELLQQLAGEFKARNYNVREFVRLLVESNAYQLSSRYDSEWKIDYVPLFARHYPRRLEGEEIHDAIVLGTGIRAMYPITGLADTPWALRMPEPIEPRSNFAATSFMIPFFRGNRDSFFRVQDGSVQQQLNLMNDTFVLNRLRVASSSTLQSVAKITDNPQAIEEMFLLFLQRKPDEREKAVALKFLAPAGSQRNTFIEDLAWVLVNKVDFLFNY
jgi:hypothetical protein